MPSAPLRPTPATPSPPRASADALTDAQKEQVTNADVLTAAEARYTDVVAIDGAEKAIDAIGDVTLTSGDAIAAARAAYDALTDSQKAEVSNYNTLLAAEARFAELKDAAARAAYAENAYQTSVSTRTGRPTTPA